MVAHIRNTFKSDKRRLGELLDEIHRGDIQLPDFQRPWVWDDIHIRALLASVSLCFPIGAVMFLETGGQHVRFQTRPVEGANEATGTNPKILILDGQQRLTSLYQALRSKQAVTTRDEKERPLKRFYYLDISACLDPDVNREEAILSIPEDKQVRTNFGRDIALDVSTREKEIEACLLPCNLLFDLGGFTDWRHAYYNRYETDTKKRQDFQEFERWIVQSFQYFDIPIIELNKDTPREAVCLVFEKVNTGGVALSIFELLTATFASDEFNLREDWEAREDRLAQVPGGILKELDGRDFIQAVTLLATYKAFVSGGTRVSCQRKDMLKLCLEDYKNNASEIEEGFKQAARLLATQCVFQARNLPYRSQIIGLAATCAALGDEFDKDETRRALSRWYWCGVFGELYGGSTESRLANDLVDLMAWITKDGEVPRTISDASFTPTRLLTLQTRLSAAYKGLFACMVQRGSLDFINGDAVAHTQGFALPVEIHHVYPRAWCKKQGKDKKIWNSVVNKTPLTSKTNRTLGGKAPSEYVKKILGNKLTRARLDGFLETHFIDPDKLISDDFGQFIRDRAIKLLNHIEAKMGKSISGRDSEEVQKAFGGSLVDPKEAPENPTQGAPSSGGGA